MARGVVVVEAAERSGSLVLARMAGAKGRDVVAVPGSPLDPRAAGTNGLIRQGARRVRHAGDVQEVLDALSSLDLAAPAPSPFAGDPQGGAPPQDQIVRVREALAPHAMAIDEIARATGLGAGRCNAILMEPELAGAAQTCPGSPAARAV